MSWAAHELESVVLHKHLKASWRISYMAILVGALLPDFTKLPVYGLKFGNLEMVKVDNPWQYHRGWPGVGPTHSLLFGVLVGVLVYRFSRSAPWAIGLVIGQWSHALSDACDSVGTMLFFPFSTQHYALGMWAYSPQIGHNGDVASYYSGPGVVWDFLWLVLMLGLAHRALSARYFHENVEPHDPIWTWLRRRFHTPDRVLRAIFRAYVFYGACRIFGWFLWARLLNPNRGTQTLDWSWGGPGWVPSAPSPAGAATRPGLVGVTVLGAAGVAATTWLAWETMRRWARRRVVVPQCLLEPQPADIGSGGLHLSGEGISGAQQQAPTIR